jgi:hypothetical protein
VTFHFLVYFASSVAGAEGTWAIRHAAYCVADSHQSREVHDAGLADENAPAAPSQQDCPFRMRDRGHAKRSGRTQAPGEHERTAGRPRISNIIFFCWSGVTA